MGVGWMYPCAYIACVKRVSNWAVCDEPSAALEKSVDGSVPAAPVPPTFDNTFVISVYDEVVSLFTVLDEAPNEAFKCDASAHRLSRWPSKGLPTGTRRHASIGCGCDEQSKFRAASDSHESYYGEEGEGLPWRHGIV